MPLRALIDVLWPARCASCGGSAQGQDLCAGCRGDLALNTPACPLCAQPLLAPASACGRCLRRRPPFDSAFVPYRYGPPLDLLVQRLKFAGDLAAGRVLAQLWVEAARGLDGSPRRDGLLLPVPLSPQRLAERGYNQTLELARPLAAALGRPLLRGALRRSRATAPQSGLDRKARQRNVNGAFVADPALRGQAVIVLDDVMTTGATLAACARALRRVGVRDIRVWALARAGRSG